MLSYTLTLYPEALLGTLAEDWPGKVALTHCGLRQALEEPYPTLPAVPKFSQPCPGTPTALPQPPRPPTPNPQPRPGPHGPRPNVPTPPNSP
ncbi:hypothetical protein V8F33_009757 [Rhypophila sp. PSN 637]